MIALRQVLANISIATLIILAHHICTKLYITIITTTNSILMAIFQVLSAARWLLYST